MEEVQPDEDLRGAVADIMGRHWVAEGYAAPNTEVYPWQWLWDSCFHCLIWAELGDHDRARLELDRALSTQDAAGFVPHMNYQLDPAAHADLWGRTGASSITQPPMYGHVVAELTRRGITVGPDSVARARAGLRFLLDERARTTEGLVTVCHPWETGCDDSPRWDDVCPGDGFDLDRWRRHKNELVGSITRNEHGSPVANPAFTVASAGFNALVAFNAAELGGAIGDDGLLDAAAGLALTLDAQWDPETRTWVDGGDASTGSGGARTADGLLPLLVTGRDDAIEAVAADLVDPLAHGGLCGPSGVHRGEPTYVPSTYWRGPAWPQLSYLLWLGLGRHDHPAASSVAASTVLGAIQSGLAEYWHPDTGAGLGAIPQSWAGLALLMET